MSRIHSRRDLIVWGAVPAAIAACAVAFFIVPNYLRARSLESEAASISAATENYMVQRGGFDMLRRQVEALRDERDGFPRFARSAEESRLVSRIARRVDGRTIADQAIQMDLPEPVDPVEGRPLPLGRRVVNVQMQGSFDEVFKILDDIENSRQVERVRKITLSAIGNGLVDARIEVEEWLKAPGGEL
ncbi:MAG: hypothetical protein O2819_00930 [Planctomycetota bacterium]|nr:hypothetical protein [Planctomycetota bacterium]MDA1105654.1 hypothetical protein [Planctomycetota bacterium]